MPQEFLPLLKPENIDQLKSLILQIMEDNDSKLEKIIQNRQNQAIQHGQDFTIENLNDLLSQQCLQKQRITSNLSHFALSLMNTIDVLWQDNEDLEYRVKDQQNIINQMSNHLQEMTKQSDFLKNRLNLAFNDLQKIEEEKQQVQEYLSSIIVKHDSSFCLNRSVRRRGVSEEEKIIEEDTLNQQPEMYFTEDQINFHQDIKQQPYQQVEFPTEYQQNAGIMSNKENLDLANRQTSEIDLLQESVIKDSISVLRRFTLSDEIQQRLPILQESQQDIQFISKSHRFTLINQISLQIFQETKENHTYKEEPLSSQSLIDVPSFEKPTARDLRISNEKINITIATGTEFTHTKHQDRFFDEQFSALHPSPSCNSFMIHRQNSAVMYPSMQRSSSTISFVTQTTKLIQTDPPKTHNNKQKQMRHIEKKSVGIEASKITENSVNSKKSESMGQSFKKEKRELKRGSHIGEQGESKKSFGQLLDYFTRKIVSDRIKTNSKKNDMGGFKKTKSNIQKVF